MKVTKEELALWYNTMTCEEVMSKLGIRTKATLYKTLDRAGIPRKGRETLRSVHIIE